MKFMQMYPKQELGIATYADTQPGRANVYSCSFKGKRSRWLLFTRYLSLLVAIL